MPYLHFALIGEAAKRPLASTVAVKAPPVIHEFTRYRLAGPKVPVRQRGSTKSTVVSRLALTPRPAKYDTG